LKTSEPHGWLVVIRNPIFISNKNFSVCVGRCHVTTFENNLNVLLPIQYT
jgi:hypothetical protein